jgi:hypothetical protein
MLLVQLLFIILYFSILLHWIVQWVLQVMLSSACSFIVLVSTVFQLHVSAYMAIFKCVGYFIFICLKDSASLLFFSCGHRILQANEYKISYTPEDGHVGRNM